MRLCSPAQFVPKSRVIAPARDLHQPELNGCFPNDNPVSVGEWNDLLTVDDKHRVSPIGNQPNAVHFVSRIDHRPVRQRVRAARCNHESGKLLSQNWTAGGKVVGGGANGSTQNKPIPAESGHGFAFYAEVEINHVKGGPRVNNYFIET